MYLIIIIIIIIVNNTNNAHLILVIFGFYLFFQNAEIKLIKNHFCIVVLLDLDIIIINNGY